MKKIVVLVVMFLTPAFVAWMSPSMFLGTNPTPNDYANLFFVFFLWAIAIMVMILLSMIPAKPLWPGVIVSVILMIPLAFSLLIVIAGGRIIHNLGGLLLLTTVLGFGVIILTKEKKAQ